MIKPSLLISGAQHRRDRKRAELALGRRLKRHEHVHHHSATQLVICQDPEYHVFLETRRLWYRSGFDPNEAEQRLTARLRMLPKRRAPIHPGEILVEEFLKPMGISQQQAALAMDMPANRVNRFIKGKRGVTADTALRLAALLKTTPQFWMNLQAACDLYDAKLALKQAS